MTRPFEQLFDCPHCGKRSTLETEFSRWVRKNNLLESSKGFCIVDQDVWVHRFKTALGRAFQCLMLVEVKTRGGKLTGAQRDTLHIVNQVTRNRRSTPTKENKWQAGTAPVRVFSSWSNKKVMLRTFGVHVLVFSGLGPENSETITWDSKKIDKEILVQLLRFDLDPDTLNPMDFRSHHKKSKTLQVKLV